MDYFLTDTYLIKLLLSYEAKHHYNKYQESAGSVNQVYYKTEAYDSIRTRPQMQKLKFGVSIISKTLKISCLNIEGVHIVMFHKMQHKKVQDISARYNQVIKHLRRHSQGVP